MNKSFDEIVSDVRKVGFDDFDGMAIFAVKNDTGMVQCITNRGGTVTRMKLVHGMKNLIKNQLAEENMFDEFLTKEGLFGTVEKQETGSEGSEEGGHIDPASFLKDVLTAAEALLKKDDEP